MADFPNKFQVIRRKTKTTYANVCYEELKQFQEDITWMFLKRINNDNNIVSKTTSLAAASPSLMGKTILKVKPIVQEETQLSSMYQATLLQAP